MSAFDPHTTQKKARDCIECHTDPKSIGLGDGRLRYSLNGLSIIRTYRLDAFVDINGDQLQGCSSEGDRPFNREEIHRILRVGICLGCHKGYEEGIYQDFDKSLERFLKKEAPCIGKK